MPEPISSLLEQAITQEQKRHAAALASIESRSADIATVERLVRTLRARVWKAEALIDPRSYGNTAAVELVLLLSCSEPELADVLEFLAADGVTVSRRVTGDIGCSRQYQLRLDRCTVRMNAYVHATASLREVA